VATQIKLEADVDIRGALLNDRDGPIMRAFYRDAKQLLGDAGVQRVRERVGARAKHPTGSFAGAVRVQDFKQGRTIMADYPQVLYGPWLEGTSERNTSTRFRGYRIFRLTRNWLRKNVGPLVEARFQQALDELRGGGRS